MSHKKTIRDVDIAGKTVLVRVDYNIPLNKSGEIESDLRIKASLPTLNYLLDHDVQKIILISHLGRPEGKVDPEFSLKPVATRLQELIPSEKISFVEDLDEISNISDSRIILAENLRFSPLEEENSEDFAKEIAEKSGADLFVQDGFAVIHRAHASTEAITRFLPSVAGFLLAKEIENLSKIIDNPKRPFLVLIGGAKISDKMPLIHEFAKMADKIAVGGAIANEYEVDSSKVIVPIDFIYDDEGNARDLGEKSIEQIKDLIKSSETIFWNGLLGMAEDPRFKNASEKVAIFLGENHEKTTIIAGGDTSGFVENLALKNPELSYSLISTGGGAALDFVLGKSLPGLDSLEDKDGN
jgi:phosphoglycerate kinase